MGKTKHPSSGRAAASRPSKETGRAAASKTGNKREAAGRLFDALQHRSIDNSDLKCEESEREADNIGRGRSRRTADSSDQHRAESNSRTDSETDPPPLFDRVRYTLQVLTEGHESDELDGHNKNEC